MLSICLLEIKMSLWDAAGKAAKAVGEGMKEQIEKQQALKARLESKSDTELKKIIQNDGFWANDNEKKLARIILRDRGY